jgi:hypothetical protein
MPKRPLASWFLGLAATLLPAYGGAQVTVVVDSPRSGEKVENKVDQAPIRGTAVASGRQPSDFDVMIVIDVSKSTEEPSGTDVDGDGQIGFNPQEEMVPPGTYPDGMVNTDPDDSILNAEVVAARSLMKSFDPKRVRVGLITFSGETDPATGFRRSETQADAWVDVPLTSDHARVESAIDAILARGAFGATDFAAGVRLAVRELAGLSQAQSQPRANAKKVILFLTDGVPSLPIGKGDVCDDGDREAAVAAAKLAKSAGIVMNTYALGKEALSTPVTAEMARVTVGTFTPVMNPGDIVALLQGVSFANIDDVVLSNLTTGEVSTDVQLNPDGSFHGYVPVREGRNQIRVKALASDGTSGSQTIELEFGHSQLTERELALELDRIRRMNKELLLLRERKRIDEFRSKEKRDLEIQIEKQQSPSQ